MENSGQIIFNQALVSQSPVFTQYRLFLQKEEMLWAPWLAPRIMSFNSLMGVKGMAQRGVSQAEERRWPVPSTPLSLPALDCQVSGL